MARSSFYYQVKQNKLPDKYKVIKKLIQSIYHQHKGRYGYRRITDELKNKGIIINHKTIIAHCYNGKLISLNGDLTEVKNISSQFLISESAALQKALNTNSFLITSTPK